jgi:hypothetical protein
LRRTRAAVGRQLAETATAATASIDRYGNENYSSKRSNLKIGAGAHSMPTVLRVGAFRFHFYSDEGGEPPHIHVATPEGECKFWLEPVRLARNKGVPAVIVREIEKLVFESLDLLLEKYHEYHRT